MEGEGKQAKDGKERASERVTGGGGGTRWTVWSSPKRAEVDGGRGQGDLAGRVVAYGGLIVICDPFEYLVVLIQPYAPMPPQIQCRDIFVNNKLLVKSDMLQSTV